MKKKIIFLLCTISITLSAATLLGGGGTIFDKENKYDNNGYWIGCPQAGSTCAHFPPKY